MSGSEKRSLKENRNVNVLTVDQVEFLAELSPKLAERCRNDFNNKTATVTFIGMAQVGLFKETRVKELPVIMMLMEVTANAGQKIGTLVDLASDTNYITHMAAERLRLRSEDVTLIAHGVARMTLKAKTMQYLLTVRVKTNEGKERVHELLCYGYCYPLLSHQT